MLTSAFHTYMSIRTHAETDGWTGKGEEKREKGEEEKEEEGEKGRNWNSKMTFLQKACSC